MTLFDYSKHLLNKKHNILMAFVVSIWFFCSFFVAQAILLLIIWAMGLFGLSFSNLNSSVSNTIMSIMLYVIMMILLCILPLIIKKNNVHKPDIGFSRLPSWTDIFITPAGFIVYLIISSLLMLIATHLFNWVDTSQVQDTGFNNLSQNYEYVLAFITLVVAAPVAEEILFRGCLFGKLRKYIPFWTAAVLTSILFGVAHGQWSVGIDTFALSMVLCWLRKTTGSLWAPILLHMTKNGIAFYFLFVNPLLFATIIK